nr:amidohydrolase family protein [Tessaracoccus sp. OS52]
MISRVRLLPELARMTGVDTSAAPGLADVEVTHATISGVRPSHGPGGDVDAEGATLLPGLWDHHTHFGTHSLISGCLGLSGDDSPEQIAEQLRRHLVTAPPGDPVLGFGFRSGHWPSPPTAGMLDALSPAPIALIAADMHSVWLSSSALAAAGLGGRTTAGFLVEDDAFTAISNLMDSQSQLLDRAVARASRTAASRGVVGIVDMEMRWAVGSWARRAAAGPIGLRVEAATYPQDLERLISEGLRSGDPLGGLASVGPLKVIFDGSMNSRTALSMEPYAHPLPELPHGTTNFTPEELCELLSRARSNGISAAVHAIGDEACRLVLDAFAATGATGTVEHAQLVAPADVARFRERGVAASVQPSHLLDDQRLVSQIWPGAGSNLFPLRALLDAGAELRFGSDAPVAPLDPWLSMDAAVNRTHHPDQAITPLEAITASVRTRIAKGQPADLTLVPSSPEALLAGEFTVAETLATMVAGEWTHSSM